MIRNSPGIQISLYFIAFACLIAGYTFIFHAYYPVLENKPISWTESLYFVVESMTTVGYTELGKFTNNITMLLAIQIIISGVIMIFIVVPLLVAPFITTLLAPTPPRKTPHALSGHTVIMGYDELTRAIVESLAISEHDILIIEQEKGVALEIATLLPAPGLCHLGGLQQPCHMGCSTHRRSRVYRDMQRRTADSKHYPRNQGVDKRKDHISR